MNQQKKNNYLEIYRAAHNNAVDLFKEAELLFDHKYFARAYVLAFTALEEISKSQFAADVFTGLTKAEDFNNFYKDHKQKIKRMEWAHIDANSFSYNLKWIGPDPDDVEEINPEKPVFHKRQSAMYVGIDFSNSKISEPSEKVNQKDAKEIIHIVETALHRIWEVTEYWGHQAGTKGFMK